jgi:transposase-like protein
MSTKNKKQTVTGVRYSDAQKNEIVSFVVQYNSKNGRGGQSAAAKKFKVTPLTISAWLKAAGVAKSGKAAPKKAAKKAVKKAKAPKAAKKAKTPKAAKKAKAGGKKGRGSRYTPEKKQEILDYVSAYNAKHGRGGQSQAVAKFKVSPITCAAWLKAAGIKSPKKGAAKMSKPAKVGKVAKAPKAVKAAKVPAPAGLAGKVASLIALNEQVRKAESELEKLYHKHDSLMVSIKGWI